MIKVINVICDTNVGGAGKCLVNFAKYCNKDEFDVKYVVPKEGKLIPLLQKQDANIIEIDGIKDKSFDLKSLRKLIKIFKQEKPDIVHTHAALVARLAAKIYGKCKIIYTRHCVFEVSPRIKKGIGRFVYKNINEHLSDGIIAVAEAAKKNLTDGGIAPNKIDVILNGIDRVQKYSEEEKNEIKQKYNISKDEHVVAIIARLEKIKGQDYFIDAAKKILEKEKFNVKFLIAGTGSDEDRLKEKVKSIGLDQKIIFTGFVENISEILNIVDVQVNASYGTEATSLSLLEGMSLGIPAIVTDYGGNTGVIQNSINGLVIPIKNADVLAEKIESLLTNETSYNTMRDGALKIYEDKFRADLYATNIENYYKKVLKG